MGPARLAPLTAGSDLRLLALLVPVEHVADLVLHVFPGVVGLVLGLVPGVVGLVLRLAPLALGAALGLTALVVGELALDPLALPSIRSESTSLLSEIVSPAPFPNRYRGKRGATLLPCLS